MTIKLKKYGLDRFLWDGEYEFDIKDAPTLVDPVYKNKGDYSQQLDALREEIDGLQEIMYAQDRYSLLTVFQAMDAAGKDGTIRRVFSGVNPHGLQIFAFKKPSDRELDQNFLWRTNQRMPERGRIGVFNRSYYEEVLIVRVRPGILTGGQRIPQEFTRNVNRVWAARYEDIANFEQYAHRNGTRILKFFLNVSRDEQRNRFLDRIDKPEKNWKFSEADLKERGLWSKYMKAYERCINETAAPNAPWYVIPADDKRNMRLIVAAAILESLQGMDLEWPEANEEVVARLAESRKQLMDD